MFQKDNEMTVNHSEVFCFNCTCWTVKISLQVHTLGPTKTYNCTSLTLCSFLPTDEQNFSRVTTVLPSPLPSLLSDHFPFGSPNTPLSRKHQSFSVSIRGVGRGRPISVVVCRVSLKHGVPVSGTVLLTTGRVGSRRGTV